VLQQRDYALLWVALLVMGFATQMAVVAVGWQVYAINRSPFDLGLIGLAEFLPLLLLALPAGQLADRFPRRLVFGFSLLIEIGVFAALLVVSRAGAHELWPFLALAVATGVASSIGAPSGRALPPEVVGPELLASAMALRSIAGQAAVIGGPVLGGILFAIRPELVYGLAAALLVVGLGCVLALGPPRAAAARRERAPGREGMLAGVGFIRRTPVILGAISLDLFAVLFGGAVALLPVFARSILHTGPEGLGVLRSAPAVGALVAGFMLVRRPLGRNAGRTLLVVVALFGASMVVFGLSRWFALSLLALAVSGFADMISMNIRSTTVALATPDPLRGRVNSVEGVFISASNELGAFESGLAAALLGAVPAVVAGGAVTIGVAAIWPRFFPALAHVDRLEDVRPEWEPPERVATGPTGAG
jgi:MFS family permease